MEPSPPQQLSSLKDFFVGLFYEAQVSLELLIYLCLSLECWGYHHTELTLRLSYCVLPCHQSVAS